MAESGTTEREWGTKSSKLENKQRTGLWPKTKWLKTNTPATANLCTQWISNEYSLYVLITH